MKKTILLLLITIFSISIYGQEEVETSSDGEQDRASMAVDATATQWSFQLAYQWIPQYYDDVVNGSPRPSGMDNYLQLRVVAPIPLKGLTLHPRLTLRHY